MQESPYFRPVHNRGLRQPVALPYDLRQRPTHPTTRQSFVPRPAKRYTIKLSAQELVNWFLAEALAAVASSRNFTEAANALRRYFGYFEKFQRPGDFEIQRLPRPVPLDLFVDPYALYGHFRFWLRVLELDPDKVVVLDAW